MFELFIRIKKHNRLEYAYVVMNVWTSKGTRQKSLKYLGRVFSLEKKGFDNKDDNEEHYKKLRNFEFKELIVELVKKELIKLGFKTQNSKDLTLKYNDVVLNVDLENLSFKTSKGKNFVIRTNEGFICKETINNLMSMKPPIKETEEEKRLATMKNLVKNVLEAGLKPDDRMFLLLYEKLNESWVKNEKIQNNKEV